MVVLLCLNTAVRPCWSDGAMFVTRIPLTENWQKGAYNGPGL